MDEEDIKDSHFFGESDEIEFNPNEGLLLERVVLHLPAVAGSAPR